MIKRLKKNQIFVFGSNLSGKHLGGAAKFAKDNFGAKEGKGEGITGQCYAFPTLTKDFKQRNHTDLKTSVERLFNFAIENPNKEFLLTEVGTGIANYPVSYMQGLFKNPPNNLILPLNWQELKHSLSL
jgi:hypothetical protein